MPAENSNALRALADHPEELRAILNATHAQLALLDTEMRFVIVNDAYERACGHRREELIGCGHFEFFPHEENERIFRRVAATAEPYYVEEKPFTYADQPERGVTYWNWSLVPVRSEGRVRAVLLSLLEVTSQVLARKAVDALAAERKRSEEALLEAARRKDEFLAMLSHELRNPLAPIRNSMYVLRHAAPGSEQALRAQTVIERQVAHVTRLVDDLLDVTRIARGKFELQRERIDLRDVVARAAEDFRLVMEERGVTFRTALPDARLWADADPTRVAQVVGNLLHNAAKFAGRGDATVLSLRAEGGQAELRVRDTGRGIDPAVLPRLFQPFVQADRSLARTEGGLGLGLALVRAIAELHGGSVRAESGGAGKGAEFVVRLPLVEAAAAQPAADTAEASSGARRVLVVDDNADAADSLAEAVSLLGHVVDVAYDGPSAIERARANRPDAVLCDIGLPGMSGYDVARALRADPGDGIQLFAVTGYARPDDVQRAIDAGFDGHIAKPADLAQIERLLA